MLLSHVSIGVFDQQQMTSTSRKMTNNQISWSPGELSVARSCLSQKHCNEGQPATLRRRRFDKQLISDNSRRPRICECTPSHCIHVDASASQSPIKQTLIITATALCRRVTGGFPTGPRCAPQSHLLARCLAHKPAQAAKHHTLHQPLLLGTAAAAA